MACSPITRVIVLTPAGRGAVASLLVEGPQAVAVVGALAHPAGGQSLADQPLGRILLARWMSADDGEEVVVCRHTDAGVEIHCHGGHAAAAAISASLVAQGCHQVGWQEWVAISEADPIAAAARVALAAAETERTAAILWDQYTGALARALADVAEQIGRGDVQGALDRVDGLIALIPLGRHLTHAWRVVFAGHPNVGKSSLTNAVLGYDRAIVHESPGTTRDIVTAETALDGWPVELADTAGLHAGGEPLEAAGMRLALARLETADLVVLVFDASRRSVAEEKSLIERWPAALRVYNKADIIGDDILGGNASADLLASPELYTSATRRAGIDDLTREIARRLVPTPPRPGQAVPFTAEQGKLLGQIREALASGDLAKARIRLFEAKPPPAVRC